MVSKVTNTKAASASSKVLRDGRTSASSKTAAASALAQTKSPQKETSSRAATASSKTLRSLTTSSSSKTAAGSALSQKPSHKSANIAP